MDRRIALLGVGNTIAIAAGAEETGGAFALIDYELAPGYAGLPPHRHHWEDEAIYVLEGHLLVVAGGTERLLGPGEFSFLPRGVVHAQRNPESEPARFLLLLLPAGFEQCFHDLEVLLEGGVPFTAEGIAPILARYDAQSMAGEEQERTYSSRA